MACVHMFHPRATYAVSYKKVSLKRLKPELIENQKHAKSRRRKKKDTPSNSMLGPSLFAPNRLPAACDRPNVCITMPQAPFPIFKTDSCIQFVIHPSSSPSGGMFPRCVIYFHPQITWRNVPSLHLVVYLRLEFFPGPGTSHTSKSSVPLPRQPYTFTLPLLTPTTTEVPA